MATSALSTGNLIDPTKQAEYPIVLGDGLARGDAEQRLVNVNYNYKTKSATAQQRSTVTRSLDSQDLYNLTISDKAPNAEQNALTYSYEGSVDPEQGSEDRNLVLVFDAERKVFVLESVASQLNFNLRSAPAKTKKQVVEQYKQLRTLHEDAQHGSGDDRGPSNATGPDEGPADESNPYDYRHFLPKDNAEDDRSFSDHAPSEAPSTTSKVGTPLIPAASRPTPTSKPRPKPPADPLRQKKRVPEATKKASKPPPPKSKPRPPPPPAEKEPEKEDVEESKRSPSDAGSTALSSQKTAASPGSNIIIDGDLIIDMGSPPPSRPFKVNPAHFSSNNTPANGGEDEYEEMDHFRLPSPAGRPEHTGLTPAVASDGEDMEDDDALAAEMEAAFEESAREEEQARSHQYHQPTRQYNVPSDDESEVSEEE